MSSRYPGIAAFDDTPERRAEDIYRERRALERLEASRSEVVRNGDRSSPPSAQNRTTGLTPKATWDAQFQNHATSATADPSDWRGKVGVAHPPPMQHTGVPGSEGVILPQTGSNYRGVSAYVDPASGGARVTEIDPSKDLLYSKMGVTSGANTAQGIQDKYKTRGTTASFKPGTVTDNAGNVMTGNNVWNRDAARATLFAAHPEIWQAKSPSNIAFSDYAKKYGEQAAHENIASIIPKPPITSDVTMPTVNPAKSTSGPDYSDRDINAYS